MEHMTASAKITPKHVAKYLKYIIQPLSKQNETDMRFIRFGTFYNKHKTVIDKLYDVFTRNNVDIFQYLDFCVLEYGHSESIVDRLATKNSIERYSKYLLEINENKKIVNSFIKSANTIASKCVSNGYEYSSDYFYSILDNGKLVQYYMTGIVSPYYLACVPNIKTLLLSNMNQNLFMDELSDFIKKVDVYETKIRNAYTSFNKHGIILNNSFAFTDSIIINGDDTLN